MKKLVFISFCVLIFNLFNINLSAQNKQYSPNQGGGGLSTGVLKGVIIDSQTNDAVEYANIVLYRTKDSTMITGTVTNEKGVFELDKVPFGSYYMVISFMGYNKLKVPAISVKPDATIKDLGTIKLEAASTALSEVKVTAERKTIEYALDKKIVNVDKNIASASGSAVDILQTVPSVTVDQDGGVSLRGNSNVTILIDGRPSSITGTNLEQIPATSIESIEVITNPSAKYNPEGMTGIINIKLKKKTQKGFNGMISANAGTGDKYNGSLNLNYNMGIVNLFGSYDARIMNMNAYGIMDRYITQPSISSIHQNIDITRNRTSNNFKIGADFNLLPSQSITLSVQKGISKNGGTEKNTSSTYDGTGALSILQNPYSEEDENGTSVDYTMNYKKSFQKKGEELTFDIIHSTNKEDQLQANSYTNYDVVTLAKTGTTDYQNSNSNNSSKTTTIQSNYILPFANEGKFEAGFQSIIRNKDDDYTLSKYDYNQQIYINDVLQSNNFIYKEQIHAVYGTIGSKFSNFSYQMGVRLEQTYTEAQQKTSDMSFTKKYFNFYPTIHLSQKLSNNQDIQLSFSRRINRPRMEMLNPFKDLENPLMIRFGNPDLNPEYINSMEFGYSKIWTKTTINTSIFYKQINNAISRYIFLDDNGIGNFSFRNITKGTSYGIELVVDQQILKWWRINANASYFRTEMNDDSGSGMSNSNYTWTAKMMSSWMLGKGFSAQLTGFYMGPMVNIQSKMNPMYSVDFAVKKDLFKDRASVNLRVSDIFNTMKFSGTSWGEGFTNDNVRKRDSRVLFLGFTYRFGGDNGKPKQRKKDDSGGGQDNMDMGM